MTTKKPDPRKIPGRKINIILTNADRIAMKKAARKRGVSLAALYRQLSKDFLAKEPK
jgi:hypothetical protein